MKLQNLLEELTEKKTDYTFQSLTGSKDERELDEVADAIVAGGQITTSKDLLLDNLRKAKVIALVKKNGEVAGVGALKIPRESYKQDVFEKIGKPELADKHTYEMGYFYVNPKYRRDISVIRGIMNELYKHKTETDNIFLTLRAGGATDKPELLSKLNFTFLGLHGNIKVFSIENWKNLKKKVRLDG